MKYTSRFYDFLEATIAMEGGRKLTKNSSDPGGWTYGGLTAKYNPEIAHLIKSGKVPEDVLEHTYYTKYYKPIRGIELLYGPLAFILFDSRVHGMMPLYVSAIQMELRRMGHRIEVDGLYGPKTMKILASLTKDEAMNLANRLFDRSYELASKQAKKTMIVQKKEGLPIEDFTNGYQKRCEERAIYGGSFAFA